MKPILLASFLFLLLSENVSAQGFSGDYAPVNWDITRNTDGVPSGAENNSQVDDTGAPGTIILTGSDGTIADLVDLDYTIPAVAGGIWSFNWQYHTNDVDADAQWDRLYVLVGGTAFQLTDDGGDVDQSGTYTSPVAITAGTVIGFRVRSIDNLFGDATFTITNFAAPAGALPVTLNFFNAKQSGEQVKLDWATQTESNSDRFEVERSTNGTDFKVIATVKAAGNTTLTQQYAAIDNNPENGNNYYRLRQVDLDGKYVYSMIKTLKWTSLQLVKVYPNPVHNKVILRFTPDRNETTSITLFDGSGRTLQQRNLAAIAGSNMVTEWNVEGLAPGIYFFRINNNLNSPLRFVKQ